MLWIRLAFRALRLSHHARSLPPSSRSPHVSSRVLARVHAASRGDIRDASVLVPRRRSHRRGRRHRSPSELDAGRSVRRFLDEPGHHLRWNFDPLGALVAADEDDVSAAFAGGDGDARGRRDEREIHHS